MDADNPDEVKLDGETLITVQPGQKYARTLPFTGFLTCLLCGSIVDQQLLDRHDTMHETR